MSSFWHIHLLGGLRLERGQEVITRFRSQKFGALLAYLALFPNRVHSREELADLLWPDADMEAGRTNLRTALASLRRQLEPPGTPAGSVLQAKGHTQVSLNPDAFRSDVAAFEAAIAAAATAARSAAASQQEKHLLEAVQQYHGFLLPGYYESWALSERDRLAEAHLRALRELALLHEKARDWDQALDFARRAVSADPLQEEGHANVIRLLMETGQNAAAKRQFEELKRLLKEQWDTEPSPVVQALLRNGSGTTSLGKTPRLSPVPKDEDAKRVAAEIAPVALPLPIPPTEAIPQNLPLHPTRFFGREDEIATLQDWLRRSSTRLITITGPGGSGKTRISAQTARTLGDAFAGGIYFVSLADIAEAERIPEAIAGAMGLVRNSSGQNVPFLVQVESVLKAATSPVLLVLDNFEQVAESGAVLVADLLQRLPHLSCLVTSRQRLRIEQEREFPLLPLPTPSHPGTPARLLEFDSVQLFVSRAQTARADFQLTARNANHVAALCEKLEGIPLAIELAAAWAELLTPAQMLQKMEQRLSLLVSRRRDVPLRHRTLRAAMESSLVLLEPAIQSFFTRLSVFRGGWSVEAAEMVCEEPFAVEYLAALRDHSLIVAEREDANEDNPLRFRMLETIREFARDVLAEEQADGAAVTQAQARHAVFFTAFVEEAVPNLTGASQAYWLRRLQTEHENLRAVIDFYERSHQINKALHLGGLLSGFWATRGYFSEGRQRLTSLLENPDIDVRPLVRARALSGLGKMAYLQSDYDTARVAQNAALDLYRAENDAEGIAKTLNELGNCEMLHSDYRSAVAFFEQSLAGYRALKDNRGTALLLNNFGAVYLAQGLPEVAKPYLEESLPLSREAGHLRNMAITLLNLGVILQNEGNVAQAKAYFEESLAIRHDLGDETGGGRVLEGLARLAMDQGDTDTALLRFEESLSLLRKAGGREQIASLCLYRGLTLLKQKRDLPGGANSLAESLTISRQIGNKHFTAFAVDGLAVVAAAQKEPERAVRLWAFAQAQREVLGVSLKPSDAEELEAHLQAARSVMGGAAFEAAQAAGRVLTPEVAAELALQNIPVLPASYAVAANETAVLANTPS